MNTITEKVKIKQSHFVHEFPCRQLTISMNTILPFIRLTIPLASVSLVNIFISCSSANCISGCSQDGVTIIAPTSSMETFRFSRTTLMESPDMTTEESPSHQIFLCECTVIPSFHCR